MGIGSLFASGAGSGEQASGARPDRRKSGSGV